MTKESKATTSGLTHDVHLRLSDDDMQLVRGVAESLGVPQSKAMRLMLRRVDGGAAAVAAAPVVEEIREALEKFARAHELHATAVDRVGANLNQVAHKLNVGERVSDDDVLMVLKQVYGKFYDVLDYFASDVSRTFRWLVLNDILDFEEAS